MDAKALEPGKIRFGDRGHVYLDYATIDRIKRSITDATFRGDREATGFVAVLKDGSKVMYHCLGHDVTFKVEVEDK